MNLATIIVTLIIAVLFVGIIISGIKKKKSGKSLCSCGCKSCANSSVCHQKK